ncbi:HEPN domain-containing protein [Dyadobacter sp. CY323]|uniref:HEPN domain-containing protein n=1 Tax=Dyadobacter sp. CY323 TaxID=2907302 RepID=UPI001F2E2C72|nr:HEPN domain-containing protein [Dyadobacter sp. CY323]MCE6992214.1 HEPN domain-containing protein [Dyadobacter sp. CY323]
MSEVTLEKIIRKVVDCLEVSQMSFEEGHNEGCVNRAYYAMFHCIQALLFISNVQSKTHVGSHTKFRELFIKSGILDLELNVMLQRAFEKRQFSDYDYDEVLTEDARESVEDAERFVNATIQYLKENNHLQ